MLQPGDVILFRAETQPYDENYHEFFLKFLGNDENGMKMSGILPRLWEDNFHPGGPSIKEGSFQYAIAKIDYEQNIAWLMKSRKLWNHDSSIPNLDNPVKYRLPFETLSPLGFKKSSSF